MNLPIKMFILLFGWLCPVLRSNAAFNFIVGVFTFDFFFCGGKKD